MPRIQPPQVSLDELKKCSLIDSTGRSVSPADLWADRTAVMVFLRHFACIACRSHAAEAWKHRSDFEKSGQRLVFIGSGSARFIDIFREDLGIKEAEVFSDPSLKTYNACHFERQLTKTLGFKSMWEGVQMFTKGYRQKGYTPDAGDLLQLGGVVVVAPGGKIVYHYASASIGDWEPIPKL